MLTAKEARENALAATRANTQLIKAKHAIQRSSDEGLFTVTIDEVVSEQTRDALMAMGYMVMLSPATKRTIISWHS